MTNIREEQCKKLLNGFLNLERISRTIVPDIYDTMGESIYCELTSNSLYLESNPIDIDKLKIVLQDTDFSLIEDSCTEYVSISCTDKTKYCELMNDFVNWLTICNSSGINCINFSK